MTLNGVLALILLYFTEFGSFRDQSRQSVVQDRPILSATKMLSKESGFNSDISCLAIFSELPRTSALSREAPARYTSSRHSSVVYKPDMAEGPNK